MSADPIVSDLENTQRLNRYSYVLNNPLTLTDPTGFDEIMGVITVTAPRPSSGGMATRQDIDMLFGAMGGGDDWNTIRLDLNIAVALAELEEYIANISVEIPSLVDLCAQSSVSCPETTETTNNSTGENNDSGDSSESIPINIASSPVDSTNSDDGNEDTPSDAQEGGSSLLGRVFEPVIDYGRRVGRAISSASSLGAEASVLEAQGVPNAHSQVAYQWGSDLNAPITTGVLRTVSEVGQFLGYTAKNGLHVIGIEASLGLDDRYNTLSKEYLLDSYNDIGISVSGAMGVPFEQANGQYNCQCNLTIGGN